MGETDFHSAAMIWLREAIQDYFVDRPDVYVGTNLLLYYQRGNPAGRRDPDVLVAKGVGNHFRRSFRVWEENVMPQVLFEISSESTWREDLEVKRPLYESLGVAEYFLFDPEGVCLDPRLQGFRLEQGVYVPLVPDANGSLESAELGLRFTMEDAMLRLTDVRTGAVVPMRLELRGPGATAGGSDGRQGCPSPGASSAAERTGIKAVLTCRRSAAARRSRRGPVCPAPRSTP